MKKVYTLSTCDTSKRILKQADIANLDFEIKDIKAVSITEAELDEMYALAGSYEELFSRRSQKYKSRGLKNVKLKEDDYKMLILEEYTFLKRPVIIDGNQIFIGNSKANVEALLKHLGI
jgi:arsenate reductase